jgi:ABC-type multidrug transport system fused ATPase/permease subunit
MTTQAEPQDLAISSQPDRSPENQRSKSLQGGNQNLAAPAVEFRNVHFFFDDERVLDGISFTVLRGEIKIILSGSGGGKSTILKLILGLLKPDEGQVLN